MKAVVVIPPVYDFYYTPHRSSALGGEILLNLLFAKGCQAGLLNFPLQSNKGITLELPAALNHLRPYLVERESGHLSFFNQYKRFGPSPEECAGQTLAHDPDLIFISCFAFCYAKAAIALAEQIRKIASRPLIICGGAGVSAHPEYFMRNPAIDYALTGEAEVCLPLFLDMAASGSGQFDRVPNLFQRINGQIVAPLQKRQTVPGEIAFVLKKTFETSASIFFSTTLSRGCPKACRFCSNFISHGRNFRTIPPERIRDALAGFDHSQVESKKQVYINFEDDNFLCDPSYFFSVLDVFKSVFPKAGFLAENGIDYTLITPELLQKLIQYGMKQFNLSMVSADEQLLNHEKRKSSLRLYETITSILKAHDIPCITYFICGLKNDNREKVVATLAYLAGRSTRVGISLFYPVPGIPDFQDQAFFDGIHPCLCAGSSAYPWNQSLSTREMVTAFRLSRFVNLLKSDQRTDSDDILIETSIREQTLYTEVKKGRGKEILPVPDLDDKMVGLFFEKCPTTILNNDGYQP